MKPLLELQRMGYEATLKDDGQNISLKYQAEGQPDPSQVKPLIEEVKKCKQEAIAFIEGREVLWELHRYGIVKIYSKTLKQGIYFARDDKAAQRVPVGFTVYTMDELRHIVDSGVTKEHLRVIHGGKSTFEGSKII